MANPPRCRAGSRFFGFTTAERKGNHEELLLFCMLRYIGDVRDSASCFPHNMLKLSKKSLNESAVGQIVNLLSNDVSRFDLIAILFHHLWIMPIQASLITYLLWRQVQYAALVGVGSLILLTIPVHAYVGKIISGLRLKIAQRTDDRVKKMAEIISGIQVIKMYGWEKPFAGVVNIARAKEIKVVTWASYVRGIVVSSAVFIERTILFITVIAYVLFGNAITADKVFSMAQFFNLLQLSLAILFPFAVSIGAETLISIKRLKEFLMLEEKQESIVERNISKGISLNNICASWEPDTKFLSGVNVEIPVGALCAIIGPVGSGKSSLLQLLLGELKPQSGSIEICGDISYSSQEAWLFASTVRKNILFGQKYDARHYKKIVKVCALERDFELFPYADKTLVGERGVSLSGGQKARINLARAVYRDADIYLMDDPLSAVDTHVGKHLFEECIVDYLKHKTRILVTHQLQYLKKADHIIVINNGKIETQGTFSELSKSEFDFAKMLIAADESDATEEKSKNNESKISRQESVLSQQSQKSFAEIEQTIEEQTINEETSAKMGASAYLEYAKAGGSACTLFLVAFLFIAGQVASNCTDLWVTFWTQQEASCHINYYYYLQTRESLPDFISLNKSESVDQNVYFYEHQSIEAVPRASGCEDSISVDLAIYVYTGLICTCIVALICRSIYYYRTAMNASRNLHNKMFISLLHAPMRFFDINPSGRILNRFSRDIGMIDEILPRIILDALQIFLVMIGILIMVFITNVYMIAIALVLSIVFYKMRGWYVTIARDIRHLEGITRSPVFSHVNATLNGISTIRASSIEPTLKKEFDLHQITVTELATEIFDDMNVTSKPTSMSDSIYIYDVKLSSANISTYLPVLT
ncbi:hypothetical protein ILUMI_00648 [Ignelater luminosus]|uniref:Multidrug resistance-associated protein lethal(2)03659 n=1 Tax=Ignelater luminosus TaxID=2038154 RepID=A0A8K0GMF7_IGNLU|nr:hypothetical protein ILUMI_00648 [Ignelater luminosus]